MHTVCQHTVLKFGDIYNCQQSAYKIVALKFILCLCALCSDQSLRARSANYSIPEDEALVMAWESVSLDPIIGIDQSSNTYWNRIYDHFHRNVKTPSSRSLGSLAHHWSSIQECCNRWAGCVEEIDCAPPSGATIQDRVSKLSPTVSKKILTTSSLNVHLLDSVGALSTLFGTPVYR